MVRLLSLLLLLIVSNAVMAQDLTPREFRSASWGLLDDPIGKNADDYAKAIIAFTSETKHAAVILGEPEMRWVGEDKKYQVILTGAYCAGNVQAQLHSGVARNDRYAGVMTLLAAYRKIQEKDKKFKVEALDELLKLHKDDKLTAHLVELAKKKPTN